MALFRRVNTTDLNEVASAIGPWTKLVWLESPTNPRQQISDIRVSQLLTINYRSRWRNINNYLIGDNGNCVHRLSQYACTCIRFRNMGIFIYFIDALQCYIVICVGSNKFYTINCVAMKFIMSKTSSF